MRGITPRHAHCQMPLQARTRATVEPINARSMLDAAAAAADRPRTERRRRLSQAALAVTNQKVRRAYSPIVIAGAVRVAGGAAFAQGRAAPASSPWPVAWDGGLPARSGRRCRLRLLALQHGVSGADDGVDTAATGERGRHRTTGGSGAVGASGARQCAAPAASRQARNVHPDAAEVRGRRDPRVEGGCARWHFGRHPDPARTLGRAG